MVGNREKETRSFHMYTTAPGGVELEQGTTKGSAFLSCRSLVFKLTLKQSWGRQKGAGLLHCSLNKSIKKQKLQSKWEGIKAPHPCHRAPTAIPQQHICPTLSSQCLCSAAAMARCCLQPSPILIKGHLLPLDTSTPSKSSLLRHLPAAQSFAQRQITPQS